MRALIEDFDWRTAQAKRRDYLYLMGTARSFLLLLILVAVLFGIPLTLLALRLIEVIFEKRRELARRIEDDSTVEEKATVEEKSTNDATGIAFKKKNFSHE